MFRSIGIIIFALFFMQIFSVNSSRVWANETPIKVISPEEASEIARKRLYPGGADEEDLRVLPQLPDAQVKVNFRQVQKDVLGDMIPDESDESAPEAE